MATPRKAVTAAVPLSNKDQREILDIHRQLRWRRLLQAKPGELIDHLV